MENGDKQKIGRFVKYWWNGAWRHQNELAKLVGANSYTFNRWFHLEGIHKAMAREYAGQAKGERWRIKFSTPKKEKSDGADRQKQRPARLWNVIDRGIETKKILCSITGRRATRSLCRCCKDPSPCVIRERCQPVGRVSAKAYPGRGSHRFGDSFAVDGCL